MSTVRRGTNREREIWKREVLRELSKSGMATVNQLLMGSPREHWKNAIAIQILLAEGKITRDSMGYYRLATRSLPLPERATNNQFF